MLRGMTTASQPPVEPDFEQPLAPVPEPPRAIADDPALGLDDPAPAPSETDAETSENDAPAAPEWEAEADWAHDHVDFYGDQIAFQVPSQSAFAALGIGAGPGATQFDQAFYARLFLSEHLSPASFRRFLTRSIQPGGYEGVDDPQGELIDVISKPLVDRLTEQAEQAKQKAKGRK